ncbi:MAG: hypothetical protein ACYC3G_02895 [Minisyncoccota bacterium]
MQEGFFKGDVCNRNDCKGILDEHEKEGGCSCHINPPCSYCTFDATFCPECGWNAEEERIEIESKQPKYEYVPIKYKTLADLDRTKIDWINQTHTHFSMIKQGVFPIGTPVEDLINAVRGTFGGRFEYLNKETGDFKYVAYTD